MTLRRLIDGDPLTLIHGDAHAWNCLLPFRPHLHPAYLIDLATYRVRPATNDLAYMMAMIWFPDFRSRWERLTLKRYLERLEERDVVGYTWDTLMDDYRRSVVVHVLTPVFQAVSGVIPASTWWNNLERILAAFEDLQCEEVLGA